MMKKKMAIVVMLFKVVIDGDDDGDSKTVSWAVTCLISHKMRHLIREKINNSNNNNSNNNNSLLILSIP